jgi:hypothetical protein
MAKSKSPEVPLYPPSAGRQIAFHQLLVAARNGVLMDALSATLATVDPESTRIEIYRNVPKDVLKILAAAAIRDEHVFPTTTVITAKPTLIGYYRLLLGSPQKTFYSGNTGLGLFKNAETSGLLGSRQKLLLPAFCRALATPLADLVRQLSPRITSRDVVELPLLTFGSQLQGANNNTIGRQATAKVFLAITELVRPFIVSKTERTITIKNAPGRSVLIEQAADPDLKITEEFGSQIRNKVAIEIKGGTDKSNAHNRAGEAEKSHQKAKARRFNQFWTLIAKEGLDLEKLKRESPTTSEWFDVSHVLAQEGKDWQEFRSHLSGELGIPIE